MSKDYEASDIVHKFVQYLVRTQTVRPNRESSYIDSDSSNSQPRMSQKFQRNEDISLNTSMFSNSVNMSLSDNHTRTQIQPNKTQKTNKILHQVTEWNFIKLVLGQELIHPSDNFKFKWDIIIMTLALFNCCFVPIQVAFSPKIMETVTFQIANYFVDFFFLLDILVNFRTVFINNRGLEEYNLNMIAKNYIQGVFFLDILATVPFDDILKLNNEYQNYVKQLKKNRESQWIQIVGILKLGRVLRLNKIIQFLKSTDDVKAGLRIFKMILYLVIYIHCFTCLWWLMVRNTETWVTPMFMEYPEKFFIVYKQDTTVQYLVALHATVQLLLGNGLLPQDILQTLICAIGIFFGAVINANIFGELSLIFQSLNMIEKEFQLKLAHINTSMIDLALPFEIQQDPSLQSQIELKTFLDTITPSMRFKVLIYQFKKILNQIFIFMDRNEEIEFILQRIDINFYEPENKIMEQFDTTFRKMLITGNGICKVYKYFDSRQRLCLGDLKEGSLVGVQNVLFDCNPNHTIETMSYCSVGTVPKEKFIELVTVFPDIKIAFKDQVIQNPFDIEREQFVKLSKETIDFLKDADEDMLRQLFYRSEQKFFDIGGVLFDVGDKCESIYYILQGVLDIVISDGYANHRVLDVLGKGSFIGNNFILKQEMWFYKAVNNSTCTTRILKVDLSVIQMLAAQYVELQDSMNAQSEHLEVYGVPQIDYHIRMLSTSQEEIQDLIVNFQKQQIWRDKRFDFVTQWLEIEHVDRELEKHIEDQKQRNQIKESIDALALMFKADQKIQESKTVSNRKLYGLGLAEVIKRHMDAEKFEEDRRSEMTVRFQRTMRRLIVLRSFAALVGQEFVIDQLDIATLTRRHGAVKGKTWTAQAVPKEVKEHLNKQDYLTSLVNHLRFEVFFQEEDLDQMMQQVKVLSTGARASTAAFKQLNNFVFNADWKKLLKKNKRLARKLLDAIKLYERPGVQTEIQEKTVDINVAIRKKILDFHKEKTKAKQVPAASIQRLTTVKLASEFTKL